MQLITVSEIGFMTSRHGAGGGHPRSGLSLFRLVSAIFSRRSSRTWALCSRLESRLFPWRASMLPFLFFAIALRAFSSVLAMAKVLVFRLMRCFARGLSVDFKLRLSLLTASTEE